MVSPSCRHASNHCPTQFCGQIGFHKDATKRFGSIQLSLSMGSAKSGKRSYKSLPFCIVIRYILELAHGLSHADQFACRLSHVYTNRSKGVCNTCTQTTCLASKVWPHLCLYLVHTLFALESTIGHAVFNKCIPLRDRHATLIIGIQHCGRTAAGQQFGSI